MSLRSRGDVRYLAIGWLRFRLRTLGFEPGTSTVHETTKPLLPLPEICALNNKNFVIFLPDQFGNIQKNSIIPMLFISSNPCQLQIKYTVYVIIIIQVERRSNVRITSTDVRIIRVLTGFYTSQGNRIRNKYRWPIFHRPKGKAGSEWGWVRIVLYYHVLQL